MTRKDPTPKPIVKHEAADTLETPTGYDALLKDIKARVQAARMRAAIAVNSELVLLYWGIGRDIRQRQQEQGWGTKVIEQLADDLRREFPDMTGLSVRNLKYMRAFAEAWSDEPIVQAPLAQLTWYHNLALLEKLSARVERLWYARAAIEHGWSRNVLVHHIELRLFERQGKATTNFARALPPPQSDLARELLKDPYNFEFLTLQQDAEERALEKGLVDHIQKFLLELGAGFAFVGRQYHLEVGDQDYYIDLLFYHLKLRAYVVIDLKSGMFKPEYAGKMNFYLAAVDDMLRHPDDAPSIGLVLCKQKGHKLVAEYALRNVATPIGISEYKITEAMPDALKGSLPTVEQLEAELANVAEQEPEDEQS
ncbi:MAG: PDDEXK nuclease domain-containing protein [Capsulimonadaceae bacterium]